MAGSHEVRGSIPLGSTKKCRGRTRSRPGPTCIPMVSAVGAQRPYGAGNGYSVAIQQVRTRQRARTRAASRGIIVAGRLISRINLGEARR